MQNHVSPSAFLDDSAQVTANTLGLWGFRKPLKNRLAFTKSYFDNLFRIVNSF